MAQDRMAKELLRVYNCKYKILTNNNIPLGSPRDYNEPWMDRNIMKIWKKKNHAWNRLGERNSRGRWNEYRTHRDHLRKLLGNQGDCMKRGLQKMQGRIKGHFSNM